MKATAETFQIRDLISRSHEENDLFQAGYDMVDRMVCVYGNITFGELFSLAWIELIPRMQTNVRTAIERGLIKKPEFVSGILTDLLANGDMSFDKYLNGDWTKELE